MISPCMTARAVLCVIDGSGFPALTPTVTLPNGIVAPIYDSLQEDSDGSSRTYRLGLVHFVRLRKGLVQRQLDDGRVVTLTVAEVPADTRDGSNDVFDVFAAVFEAMGQILAVWRPTVDTTTNALVVALENDATQAGVVARDLWPAAWRLRRDTDDQGHFTVDGAWVPPVGLATGAYVVPG